MLRLNNSSLSRTSTKSGVNSIQMFATFDDITKTGRVRAKHSQRFTIQDGLLSLNGKQHLLVEPLDFNADPLDLMQYFTERFNSDQPDIFLEPPQCKDNSPVPKLISEVRWEYLDMPWRAIDKSGTVAYFERRPVLDKAGYWVSITEGVMPKYGKSLCIADTYVCSLQSNTKKELKGNGNTI